MRIVIESQRDCLELHMVDSQWYTEGDAEIEIEAALAIPGVDVSQFCTETFPQTMRA